MQALAQLTAHIPNRGEQMIRGYGFYFNKSRGLCKKAGTDVVAMTLIESEVSSKEFRKSWARLNREKIRSGVKIPSKAK